MGASCMRTKAVGLPVRVVHVTQKQSTFVNDIKTNDDKEEDVFHPTPITPKKPQTHKNHEHDSPATANHQGPVTPIKVFENNHITEVNVDMKVLHIGEHYLSGEKELPPNSEPQIKRGLSLKKRNPAAKSIKIDKIVNKVRDTLGPTRIKELSKKLQTDTDICIRQYSKEQPVKFNKLYYEGLTMKHRWGFWKARLQPDKYFVEGLYEKFLYLYSKSTADIRKDVHRTFPEETYFSGEDYGKIGQNQLCNVLKALSIYFPSIGYCQGMNFIVGFLLLINGGDELEAFWMFVALARNPDFLMMGFFEANFPLLDFYIHVFYEILNRDMPQLCAHMKSLAIPDSLWITKWVLTVFLYSLPANKVVRIWDYIMSEELLSVLKVALSLLKMYEKDLLKSDIMGVNDLFRFLQKEKAVRETRISQDESSFIFSAKEVDIDLLIKTAKKVSLTKAQIGQYCKQFIARGAKQPNHMYYKFYSEYEINSKNEGTLAEFQQEIDWKIMQFNLIDDVKPSQKKEQPFQERVPSMILKDLEIEDVENSSVARKIHLQNVQEEGEVEDEADEEAKDDVVDLSKAQDERGEGHEDEESKSESIAEHNPLHHFALKDNGNFETTSWIDRTSQNRSQGANTLRGGDTYPSEIDELKMEGVEQLGELNSAKGSTPRGQTVHMRSVLAKKSSNTSIFQDWTHRSSKNESVQDFSQKIAIG